MRLRFAAISRGQRYSPNHIGNDAKILNLTIQNIENSGHEVSVYDEDSITPALVLENNIFSMIRGNYALQVLQQLERSGALVINNTKGVKNCYRARLAELLPKAGLPVPKGIVVPTASLKTDLSMVVNPKNFNVWLKRGDVHAIHREDITLVHSEDELYSVLQEYRRRGIDEAVIQQHIPGPTIKFYAVRGTGFFHWYYHPGTGEASFEVAKLKDIAHRCAVALDVDIYGGDAVIAPDGSIWIIDLNDWPSFAPVREEAAFEIAKVVIEKALQKEQQQGIVKRKAG